MPKAGTGWVFENLHPHPAFWMPPLKELHYLDHEAPALGNARKLAAKLEPLSSMKRFETRRRWSAPDSEFMAALVGASGSRRDFEFYESLFRFKGDLLSGDITPRYAALEGNVIREIGRREIGRRFPDLKVILLVRDPVARAWSHLNMLVRIGRLKPELLQKPDNLRKRLPGLRIQNVSRATKVHRRWSRCAPHVSLRHFFFDDILKRPEKLRREILLYLGADPGKSASEMPPNRKADKPQLERTPEVTSVLAEVYSKELRACARDFAGVAHDWVSGYGV